MHGSQELPRHEPFPGPLAVSVTVTVCAVVTFVLVQYVPGIWQPVSPFESVRLVPLCLFTVIRSVCTFRRSPRL
jgi:hypothetical protein